MAVTDNQQFSIIAVTNDTVKHLIYVVRRQQVMLDSDLASLYQVATKVFNQAVKRNLNAFHDRFLILDNVKAYHIGASLKDAGKKCFTINLLEYNNIIQDILRRLNFNPDRIYLKASRQP